MIGKSQLANTNKLIKTYKGATGLKTGSTGLALYNLSASATRDNFSLIAVIMKAPSTKVRFAEAAKLLDYGFNNFSYKQLGKQGDTVKDITISKGVKKSTPATLEKDSGLILKKGEDKNISQTMTLDESISAPITNGQKLGEINYTLNDEIISTVNIVASEDVDNLNLFTMSKRVYYNWINLLRGN